MAVSLLHRLFMPVESSNLPDAPEARSLVADIDQLLYTERRFIPSPATCEHLAGSLIDYGLLPFAHLMLSHEGTSERLRGDFQTTLTEWEPRLKSVSVQETRKDSRNKAKLTFDIHVELKVGGEVNIKRFVLAMRNAVTTDLIR